ncbi:hypothetical protein ScPMuIL_004519 [Solemya velum]
MDWGVLQELSHMERSVVKQLAQIFPQLSQEILEASVRHPSNQGTPCTYQTLLQRCIDDLLDMRTFNLTKQMSDTSAWRSPREDYNFEDKNVVQIDSEDDDEICSAVSQVEQSEIHRGSDKSHPERFPLSPSPVSSSNEKSGSSNTDSQISFEDSKSSTDIDSDGTDTEDRYVFAKYANKELFVNESLQSGLCGVNSNKDSNREGNVCAANNGTCINTKGEEQSITENALFKQESTNKNGDMKSTGRYDVGGIIDSRDEVKVEVVQKNEFSVADGNGDELPVLKKPSLNAKKSYTFKPVGSSKSTHYNDTEKSGIGNEKLKLTYEETTLPTVPERGVDLAVLSSPLQNKDGEKPSVIRPASQHISGAKDRTEDPIQTSSWDQDFSGVRKLVTMTSVESKHELSGDIVKPAQDQDKSISKACKELFGSGSPQTAHVAEVPLIPSFNETPCSPVGTETSCTYLKPSKFTFPPLSSVYSPAGECRNSDEFLNGAGVTSSSLNRNRNLSQPSTSVATTETVKPSVSHEGGSTVSASSSKPSFTITSGKISKDDESIRRTRTVPSSPLIAPAKFTATIAASTQTAASNKEKLRKSEPKRHVHHHIHHHEHNYSPILPPSATAAAAYSPQANHFQFLDQIQPNLQRDETLMLPTGLQSHMVPATTVPRAAAAIPQLHVAPAVSDLQTMPVLTVSNTAVTSSITVSDNMPVVTLSLAAHGITVPHTTSTITHPHMTSVKTFSQTTTLETIPHRSSVVTVPRFTTEWKGPGTSSTITTPLPTSATTLPPMTFQTGTKEKIHVHIHRPHTLTVGSTSQKALKTPVNNIGRNLGPPVIGLNFQNEAAKNVLLPSTSTAVERLPLPEIMPDGAGSLPIVNTSVGTGNMSVLNIPSPSQEIVVISSGNHIIIPEIRLVLLFPDIDPAYAKTLLDKELSDDPINYVCNYLLEAPYPKKKKITQAPSATVQSNQSQSQMDSGTDPFSHYSTIVDSKYREEAMSALTAHFRWIYTKDLRKIGKFFNFHYAPTHRIFSQVMQEATKNQKTGNPLQCIYHLLNTKVEGLPSLDISFMKAPRFCRPLSYTNPQLVSEMQFVTEKMLLVEEEKDHLIALQCNEKEYEDTGQLITCGCCYGDFPFEEMIQCAEGHLFCQLCLQSYAQEAVFGSGKANLSCMTEDCESLFPLSQLKRALTSTTLTKYEDRVQEENINLADLDDLVRCPHCDFAALMDPGDKVFKCQNQACLKETCRYCKEDWTEHFGKRCEEVEKKDETKLRLEFEEKMTAAKIRTCHMCKTKFTKLDGCNKMTCRCGAKMCYICRKPTINYNHFCQHVRDPGKSCQKCESCFLWSNPEEDEERAIQEIQKQAKEVRKQQGYEEDKLIGAPSQEPPTKKVKR